VAASFALYSSQWLAVIGFLPVIYAAAGVGATATGVLTALAAAVNMIGNLGAGRLLQRGVPTAGLRITLQRLADAMADEPSPTPAPSPSAAATECFGEESSASSPPRRRSRRASPPSSLGAACRRVFAGPGSRSTPAATALTACTRCRDSSS
jgi:hypothetical protein